MVLGEDKARWYGVDGVWFAVRRVAWAEEEGEKESLVLLGSERVLGGEVKEVENGGWLGGGKGFEIVQAGMGIGICVFEYRGGKLGDCGGLRGIEGGVHREGGREGSDVGFLFW